MGVGFTTTCLHQDGSTISKELLVDPTNEIESFAVLGVQKPPKEYWHIPVLDVVDVNNEGADYDRIITTPTGRDRDSEAYTPPPILTTPPRPFDASEFKSQFKLEGGLPRPCPGDGSQKCCQHLSGRGQQLAPAAIVFLDVDGVLHSTGAMVSELFGSSQLREVARIVRATNAQIVLSTAWRLTEASAHRTIHELYNAGCPLPISSTPNLRPGHIKGRAQEISAWLSKHDSLVDEGRWLAIDDIALSPDLPADHVITTDCQLGLTTKQADEGIAKLLRNSHDTSHREPKLDSPQ